MSSALSNMRHAIALIVLCILAYGVYMLATRVDFFTGAENRAETFDREVTRLEIELLEPLNQLNAVVLDETFFMTPEYLELKDKSVPLTEPALERSNPFAAI